VKYKFVPPCFSLSPPLARHQPVCDFCPSSSAPDPKNHHIIKFGTNIDLSDAKRSVRLDQ
jgi:hypothetical protein